MKQDTWEKMANDSYILGGDCKRCGKSKPVNKHGDCEFCDKVMPLSIDENLDYQIAKARADERAKLITEIEGWLVDETGYTAYMGNNADWEKVLKTGQHEGYNKCNNELRAKLAELKGGE